MDYQNRAGSKKGAGGLASDAQENLSRRKQVDNLLRDGEDVPYTFQQDNNLDDKIRKNPYIYRNHSGKLVCKLCNTLHMSWSSVERHISGKKHTLNVIRRGNLLEKHSSQNGAILKTKDEIEFRNDIESRKRLLKNEGIVPHLQKAIVQDKETQKFGLAMQVDYSLSNYKHFTTNLVESDISYSPLIRIVSGLELTEEEKKDKKYLVIAYEPFENIAVEIPADREIFMNKSKAGRKTVDELNEKCTLWDESSGKFYVQVFFE